MNTFMKGAAVVLGAFLVHAALQQISAPALIGMNVFAVAVIVFGLIKGETAGALVGMTCGLLVDSFSLGIFGLSGVTYTVTGFLSATISKKIHVLAFGRLVAFMGLMGVVNLGLWTMLSSIFLPGGLPWEGGLLLVQPLITAALGTCVVLAYRRLKARHEK